MELQLFSFPVMLMIAVFVMGYLCIVLESVIKINKTAIALLMAVLCWGCYFYGVGVSPAHSMEELSRHLADESQVVFFLLGAMTLVELIDAHEGFALVADFMKTRSRKKMLWLCGFVAFFLSAVIDNLTSTIVMISILRKLVTSKEDRLILGSMIVIGANAGGAWTPIGDVTTTMLWIQGRLSIMPLVTSLFLPSVACLVGALLFQTFRMQGQFALDEEHCCETVPLGNVVLVLGILALICVPILKGLLDLPPFMGMLVGVGALWLITDLAHHKHEAREHLRVPHILSKIDNPGILFFLGILLAVDALESSGLLMGTAHLLDTYLGSEVLVAGAIGLISAVVDNVPLVAASIGMYPLTEYPIDAPMWQLIALCAGTGGSILIIGSAAGIAFMGLEKVDFMWFLRRVSLSALVGYLLGMAVYLAQRALFL